jgi:hypothetical protein
MFVSWPIARDGRSRLSVALTLDREYLASQSGQAGFLERRSSGRDRRSDLLILSLSVRQHRPTL